MELKYSALLSPIKIGNMVLRNRMLSSASTPHFLQGTEKNPTEKVIQHFANRAKNGAALVTINHLYEKSMPVMGRALDNTPCHFNLFDLNDANAQDYFCKLLDAIHFYGSKTCAYIMSPANMQGGAWACLPVHPAIRAPRSWRPWWSRRRSRGCWRSSRRYASHAHGGYEP